MFSLCVGETLVDTLTHGDDSGVISSTGTDVAGEVVSLGPGVKRFSPGDKVLTYIHILVSTHSERTRC